MKLPMIHIIQLAQKTVLKLSILILMSSVLAGFNLANAANTALPLGVTNPLFQALPTPSMIHRDISELSIKFYSFDKYMIYPSPKGGNVILAAQDKISDEQLLRAWNILDFYLTDVPETK